MKLTKYLMLGVAGFLFTSCNSDEYNTAGDVTVEMEYATLSVKENRGIVNAPLVLKGKTNGPVVVTVDVTEVSSSPAQENVHYLLTSNTVVFPNDSAQVGIEFSLVNDMEINEDRAFIIQIVKAEGAKIGTQNTTEVTIRDDDGLFYEALQGEWTMNEMNWFDESPESFKLTITGVDEGEDGYEKTLYISGWSGFTGANLLTVTAEYYYDMASNEITIELPYDQMIGTYGGQYEIYLYGVSPDGYLMDEGALVGTVSSDLRTIEFYPDDTIILYAWTGSSWAGGLDAYYEMKMTR